MFLLFLFTALSITSFITESIGIDVTISQSRDFEDEEIFMSTTEECQKVPYPDQGSDTDEGYYGHKYPFLRPSFDLDDNDDPCIVIFAGEHCFANGRLIKSSISDINEIFTYLDYDNGTKTGTVYNFLLGSIRDCTAMERKTTADLDYYENKNPGAIKVYRDVNRCTNLPVYETDVTVRTYGKCFKFYKTSKCYGYPYIKSNEIWFTSGPFQSMNLCSLPDNHIRLITSIFSFVLASNITSVLDTLEEVSLTKSDSIDNDGLGMIESLVSFKQTVEESASFSFSDEFQTLAASSNFHGVEHGIDVEGTIGFSVPNAGEGSVTVAFSGKVAKDLTKTSSNTTNLKNGITESTKTTREIEIVKQLIVPSCTKYTVISTIQLADDVEIDYNIQIEITGEGEKNEALTSMQILNYLEGNDIQLNILKEHEKANNFNIIGESTAKLIAKYGLHSVIHAVGEPLEDCFRRHQQCTCTD